MKKLFISIFVLTLMMLIFVSCNNSIYKTSEEYENMLRKLYEIKKGWTVGQTRELLGEPDKSDKAAGEDFADVYNLKSKEMANMRATIFFTNNKMKSIIIKNTKTGEVILDTEVKTSTSTELLEKLYQIKKGWTEEQVKELLGEQDETDGYASIGWAMIYNVSDTEKVIITFFGASEVSSTVIYYTETGERVTILY